MTFNFLDRFDWDADNTAHVALHNILPEEAEQALDGDTVKLREQMVRGEVRFAETGITRRYRFLIVVWTPREHRIRVVTAFPANRAACNEWMKRHGGRKR